MDWQVNILQRPAGSPQGTALEVIPVLDGVAKLGPGPFMIQVQMPEPLPVKLNVLGNDSNFKRIVPGLSTGEVPPAEQHCFSLGTGLPEPQYHDFQLSDAGAPRVQPYRPDTLYLDDMAHHELYYQGPQDHRWTAIIWSPNGPLFFREVQSVSSHIGRFQAFDGHDLYLTFLVKCSEGEIIQPEELRKIQVQF